MPVDHLTKSQNTLGPFRRRGWCASEEEKISWPSHIFVRPWNFDSDQLSRLRHENAESNSSWHMKKKIRKDNTTEFTLGSTPINGPHTPQERSSPSVINIRLLTYIRIGHININRLSSKIDKVRELVQGNSLKLLAVTETWLTHDISDGKVSIPDFHLFRRDRPKTASAGVCIYTHCSLPVQVIHQFSHPSIEMIWLKIEIKPSLQFFSAACTDHQIKKCHLGQIWKKLWKGWKDMMSLLLAT